MSCSLSRSQSCCSLSRSQSCSLSRSDLEAEIRVDQTEPPSTDFITRTVDEISGEVGIKRHFHKHPLVLSTYLKVDEFNFCCFCKIYFTVGEPIYSCVPCYMCIHQSCGELPLWIHSTSHPQHELRLTVNTRYLEDTVGRDVELIFTCAYECAICSYNIGIKEALQSISISLFNNTYLNRPASSSLRLSKITPLPKEEGLSSSIMVSREVYHFYHEHPLILSMYDIREENERCQLCRRYFAKVVTIYSCKGCNFSLHKSCAELPYLSRSLSFPMEDKRKSQIIFSEPPTKDSRGTSLTLSSFFNFQLAFTENVDQIRHILHVHPLVFTISKMEYISQKSRHITICLICFDKIRPDDRIYICHECDRFLHESCSKIPQTMRSTWHPAHMLQIMPESFRDCQLCNRERSNSWIYGYGCDECDIYIHSECVSAYSFEDHKEHTFHFGKASIFTCDACGITETKERISCICTSCPMQVHKQCSNSFPRTVKQKRHHHKLNLTYFFEVDFDYANETCKICFNQMNKVYCMYQCHDCSYMAHVKCATSKEIVEDESVVDKIGKLVITEVGEGQKVKHFGHTHPLVFTKEIPTKIDAYCDAEDLVFTKEEPTKTDAYCDAGDLIFTEEEEPTTKFEAFCDACVSPISAPFYACATDDECNFYLHKRCFELPLEIQHPLHEHRLTLTSMKKFFNCYGCGAFCNGFMYACTICIFEIDVRCSLLSDTLKHDGHDCTLTLIDYYRVRHDEETTAASKPKCSVCDDYRDSSCKFSCKRCNFHLDLGCASLPKYVTHECPKHGWKARPLQLTYGGIPDASGIYFCDMCEESRDINHWFYDCDDCVWSNHPRCVLGEFQFKYEKTYEPGRHRHKMQLVKKTLSRYNVISCGFCHRPLIHSSLFCSTCNLYFHIYCGHR